MVRRAHFSVSDTGSAVKSSLIVMLMRLACKDYLVRPKLGARFIFIRSPWHVPPQLKEPYPSAAAQKRRRKGSGAIECCNSVKHPCALIDENCHRPTNLAARKAFSGRLNQNQDIPETKTKGLCANQKEP